MWRYLNRVLYIRFIDLQTLNAHTFIFRYLFSIINGFLFHQYIIDITYVCRGYWILSKINCQSIYCAFHGLTGKIFCHSTRTMYDCFKWLGLVVVMLNFLQHLVLHGTRKETVHWPTFILIFFFFMWLIECFYGTDIIQSIMSDDFDSMIIYQPKSCNMQYVASCTICWIYWVN